MHQTINVQMATELGATALCKRLSEHLKEGDGAVVVIPPGAAGWSCLSFERLPESAVRAVMAEMAEELGAPVLIALRGRGRVELLTGRGERGAAQISERGVEIESRALWSALGESVVSSLERATGGLMIFGVLSSALGLEHAELDFSGLVALGVPGTVVLDQGRCLTAPAFRMERGVRSASWRRAEPEVGALWLELEVGRAVEAGQSLPVSIALTSVGGPTHLEVLEVVVRGQVREGLGLRDYESSVEVARDREMESDEAGSFGAMLDVPVDAAPSGVGVSWWVEVRAIPLGGETVTEEARFVVARGGVEPPQLALGGVESLDDRADDLDAGEAAQLDDGPAMTIPGVRVRFVGGVYALEIELSDRPAVMEDLEGRGGRHVRWGCEGERWMLRCGVRPASVVDLRPDTVEALGLDGVPWLEEVMLDNELGLTPLARWDHVHRRCLALFGRQLSRGLNEGDSVELGLLREAVQPGAGLVLEGVSGGEQGERALIQAFVALVDGEASGPLRAVLRGARGMTGDRSWAATGTLSEVKSQLVGLQAGGHWEDAVSLCNQAVVDFVFDAEVYALKGRAYMNLGLELRAYHGEQVGHSKWRYPEAYRERAQRVRHRMERAFEVALWLEPSAAVAAQLGEMLKHPMDALGAFELAYRLSGENDRIYRVLYAQALVRAEGVVDASRARALLEPLEGDVEAELTWALARLMESYEGGEPSFYHYGLTGEPRPVVLRDEGSGLREALEVLGRGGESAERGWLREQLEQLVRCGESDPVAGLKAGMAMAQIARLFSIERLGRLALAVALRGRHDERKVTRLVRRAEICELIFARDEAERLLDSAELLCSRESLPVLNARVAMLRGRGEDAAARRLELRLVKVAPEQTRRVDALFEELVEQGELDMVEELFRFFLLELRGSRTAMERLVAWAERLVEVFEQMGDHYRARQPVEWLLFAGEAVTEEERERLTSLRDKLDGARLESAWSSDEEPTGS